MNRKPRMTRFLLPLGVLVTVLVLLLPVSHTQASNVPFSTVHDGNFESMVSIYTANVDADSEFFGDSSLSSSDGQTRTLANVNQERKGMTWYKRGHIPEFGVDLVGCADCDPYHGDTVCSTELPILCLKKEGLPNPGLETDFYHGWTGGHIGLTLPIAGNQLTGIEDAALLCEHFVGSGYQMASHHDGNGGWNWYAYGNVDATTSFWTYIRDQDANCWGYGAGAPAEENALERLLANVSKLTITKSGPATAVAGAPITYTLTVSNLDPISATNSVIVTDTLPTGASYVSGGTLVGNVVSWTVPELAPSSSLTVTFVVTATQTITNSDYGVTADGGYSAIGKETVVTIIPPTDNLVAYYRFDDGTATDSSGHDNHGTIYGAPESITGVAGEAFRFAGRWTNPDKIIVPNSESLSFSDDFTFTFWFNVESQNGIQTMLAKSGDRRGLTFRPWPFGDFRRAYVENGRCCGSSGRAIWGGPSIDLYEWHMLSITHGDGLVKLYLAGVLGRTQTAAAFNINPSMANEPLHIGIGQLGTFYPFGGILDEIRIYNRVLDASELHTLYEDEVPHLSVTPPHLLVTLFEGTVTSETLTIGNTGTEPLAWTLSITNTDGYTNTDWLSPTPISGTFTPSASEAVTLTLDATTLTPGDYEGILTFTSNDPIEPSIRTRVRLKVGAIDLDMAKTAPITATVGAPITYTLTVTNSGNLPATNLLITDTLPTGANYVSGGTLNDNVVSWSAPSLGSNSTLTRQFIVTATQTITNSDYRVTADSGYSATGSQVVVTEIDAPSPPHAVILALSPVTVTTGLGETFELPIEVWAGIQPVDGATAHLNFDPTYLEVVSIAGGEDFSAEILNQFDNDSGELDYAAGSFNSFPNGTFNLAIVTFRTKALTEAALPAEETGSPIDFNMTLPRLSDATFDGVTVLSDTINSTIFVEKSAVLALEPLTITALVGETFDLPILVQAGTQPVDGASAYLNFDSSLLEVVTITAGSELPNVLANSFDNSSGELEFAAGTLSEPYPTGTFTLATVTFRTLASTEDTPITFNTTVPRQSDMTFSGTSVLKETTDGSTIIVPKIVIMALDPPSMTLDMAQPFDIAIQIEADSQQVNEAIAVLNFDPTLMQVVTITPGSDLPNVITSTFDNSSGQLEFAAKTSLPLLGGTEGGLAVSGTFTLATVTFNARAQTDGTSIDFGSLSDATYDDATVLSDTTGSEITIRSANLVAFVDLDGREAPPHSQWSVPLRVNFTRVGEETPAYALTPTTDNSGTFTITNQIAPGSYEVRVKKPNSLQNTTTFTLTAGSNTLDLGTFREGDADDNNYVTLVDFSILVSTFAKCEGDPDYDARADFNNDNCVTIIDFSLMVPNFAQGGDRSPQGRAAEGDASTGDAKLIIDQPIIQAQTGKTYRVAVRLEADDPVDGAAAYIDFDASLLKVNSITSSNTFELELQNEFDNQTGMIHFAAGTLDPLTSLGEQNFDLAVIELEAIGNGESPLLFQFDAPRTTNVTSSGESVLSDYVDGSDSITPTAVQVAHLTAHKPVTSTWMALIVMGALLVVGIGRRWISSR